MAIQSVRFSVCGRIHLHGRCYFARDLVGHPDELVQVDDLDVAGAEEIAVRLLDGRVVFAEAIGSQPWNPMNKGRFERALRHRQPFAPQAPAPAAGIVPVPFPPQGWSQTLDAFRRHGGAPLAADGQDC